MAELVDQLVPLAATHNLHLSLLQVAVAVVRTTQAHRLVVQVVEPVHQQISLLVLTVRQVKDLKAETHRRPTSQAMALAVAAPVASAKMVLTQDQQQQVA
jgi:phosphopantetheine adenylyltransferase